MKKFTIVFGLLLSLGLTTCYATEQGHAAIQKIVSEHPIFRNIPITAVDKYAVILKFGDTFALGVNDVRSKREFVAKIENKTAFRHAVMHEACHYIWYKSKPAIRWQYCRAYDLHAVSVSRYGKTNCKENFAELCARINGSDYRNYTLPQGYLKTSDQYKLSKLMLDQWEKK